MKLSSKGKPAFFSAPAILANLIVAVALLFIAGCSEKSYDITPLGQTSFARYQQETTRWVEQNRVFQTDDKSMVHQLA
ncbi:hypothetical protein [Brenneria salicis]|uniref:Uncharacterized protein n=1 Tax=Brenneria salicis ATCC 15712 = DSM 30166 TaxID=714314 RepID=A0A366IEA9_9GAMM|nr:hypothetical protein [Brenneria salicis]RBP67749.1 hypothetical protein DES54_101271 [Brenneria salicis ATCC 15712 = DSM 30166]RLM32285.1 hypothetical protein BHG07_00170 [Brenneria salicis ATCC 15712 = DSM 30166]